MPRAERATLAVATLLYLALTLLLAGRRLWHDELYTFYIGTAPTLSRLWQDMALDLHPPLEYLAVRMSVAVFGTSALAVRLPSVLAFLAGSLCLWRFVARRLSPWYGLLALAVLWASPAFYYATEARPYAWVICFTGLMLVFWRRAIDAQRTTGSVWLLAGAVTGMMLSHMLALFYVMPFCLAELIRTYKRRAIDGWIWAALLVPCAIPFLYLQVVQRFGAYTFPPVFRASVPKIAETYYGSLKVEALPLLIALLLALLLATWRSGERRSAGFRGPADFEMALMGGFLAIPAIVNLALMPFHGAYFDRYSLPVEFCYALGAVFFLAYQTSASRPAAMVAASVLLLFVSVFNLRPSLRQSVWGHGAGAGDNLVRVRPDLPLVAASGLTFLEMDHYEDAATVGRLYYLTDRNLALRYAGATIFETMPMLKRDFPIRGQVVSFEQFTAQHKSFLVLGTPDYPEDWLLRSLVDGRGAVQYLGNFSGPYKDTELFEVAIGY